MKFNKKYICRVLVLTGAVSVACFLVAHTALAVALDPPIAEIDIVKLLTRLIKVIFAFTGVLALLQFIYGGLLWMTSGGNAEKVKKGKDSLLWAILGIIVVFLSYALVSFVITNIRGV